MGMRVGVVSKLSSLFCELDIRRVAQAVDETFKHPKCGVRAFCDIAL